MGVSPIVQKKIVQITISFDLEFSSLPQMYCKLVSCAEFKAILRPLRDVV